MGIPTPVANMRSERRKVLEDVIKCSVVAESHAGDDTPTDRQP